MNSRERDFQCGGCWLNFHRYGRRVDESRKHFALGLLLQDDRRVVTKLERGLWRRLTHTQDQGRL